MKLLVVAAAAATVSAHALALQAGDLAFTAFNADEDGWSVLLLADLAPGTTIYFSEQAWDPASMTFLGGEANYTWSLDTAGVARGTVVRFSDINRATRTASIGQFDATGSASLSVAGESLFAYVGASAGAPTAFLSALSTEGFAGGQLDGTGLLGGGQALMLPPGTDYAEYVGLRSGMAHFADYLPLINDPAHWQIEASGDFSTAMPDLSAFAVSAVPEPGPASMLLAGLGVMGLATRRCAGSRWRQTAAG